MSEESGVDAIEMLKDDHKKVKALFREYEAAGDAAFKTKQRIADKVFSELEVHSMLEEEIFYPAVKECSDEEGQDLIEEGVEEHHVVKVLIKELKRLTPEDDVFDAKFKVLTENVEHHIDEEEGEMLPDARGRLGDEIESLGDEMEARKNELLSAAR
jgi:hemerythrin-like domain-containing protein